MIVTDADSFNAASRVPRKSISGRRKFENDKTIPYMINLHEDPQLSGQVYYPMTKGVINIGRKTAEPMPDIILGAVGIQKNHAKIKLNAKGLFELIVVPEGASSTMVNGESLTTKKKSRVLNHCDRISFAGGNIYVFKYPKLKRSMKFLIDASEEIKQQSSLTKEEQEDLAWQMVLQNGIEDVKADDPSTLKVADYSPEEIAEDEQAVDWDKAFFEVENGEKIKQERIQQERQRTH